MKITNDLIIVAGSKVLMTKLLFVVLTSAILVGLSPMSHHMSVRQTMHMDEMALSYQSNIKQESAGENSTGSCCDEIASFAIGCSFLVPQYSGIDSFGGSIRVMISDPIVRSISLKTLTPPPKA